MAKKPEKPEKSEKPEKTEPPEKPEPADLLALVAALHRQHRRLRWTVVMLTLVTLVALAGAGAALLAPYNAELGLYLRRWLGRPETIASEKTILEAEKFALRTPDGKVRAALAARDDATPSLALYDDDGTARAGLELGTDGQANLWFAGKDGQVTVSLNPRSLRLTDAEGGVFVTRSALVLADRKQRNRVTLGVKPDGSPSLTLADKEGRTGALVDVVDEGSRLGLFYDGMVRAGIGFGPGGSQLNLYGDDGKDHATLSLAPDGATGLIFHGQDGKQRAALGVAPNNASGLSLFDKGGSQRAAMSVVPEGSPRLELFDAGGGRRANLALSAEGLPALQLEEKGQPRAVLGAGSEGKRRASTPSSLLLFDKDGSVIFQAPFY